MRRPTDEAILNGIQDLAQRVTESARRHPVGLDMTTAIALATVSLIGLGAQGRLHHVATIVFCGALCLPLSLRTVDRRLSFAVVAVVALSQGLISTPQLADGAILIALFWIALDGPPSEIAPAAVVVEVGAVLAALRWSPGQPLKVWVGINGLAVAAAAVGLTIRERRALVVSLRERAARLELERDQEGRLGAAAERARIAREMHDIVSHNLTVMIGLADGAAYALPDAPDSARSAIQRVSGTGRQALEEMRRLLGVLRDEPQTGTYEPQPGLDRLDDLLARVEAAGIPVSIAIEGDPQALSAGLQLTIFRVAQEALTNTLKHAGRPANASLSLRCRAGWVTLEVIDTGAPGPPSPEAILPSGGRGLQGMRERAAAFGGELEAGPRPERGWRVALTLASDVGAVVS
jgi:signal transduction histidine kinase